MNRRIIIVSIIIFLFALCMNIASFHEVVPIKKALDDFPLAWKGWKGDKYFFDAVILDKLGADEYISRSYIKGTDRINLYIGYYGSQKEGAQIHSPKHCLPGSGWFKLFEKNKILDIENTGKINYIEALYQKGSDRELFIYWYRMQDVSITNDYILKWYMIINSLRYRRNDAAFIRFSTLVVKDVEDAENVIKSAMKDLLPLLKDYLPE